MYGVNLKMYRLAVKAAFASSPEAIIILLSGRWQRINTVKDF